MKKRDIFIIVLSLGILLATAWFADLEGIYPAVRSAHLAVGGFLILYLEASIHECGHAIVGKRFGARVAKLQFGVGPTILCFTAPRLDQAQVSFCLIPFGGRVDFDLLPVTRSDRIRIFAAGVVSVMIALPILWFLIPQSFDWLRAELVFIFFLSSTTNAFYNTSRKMCEEGIYADGQAIRGLRRYS